MSRQNGQAEGVNGVDAARKNGPVAWSVGHSNQSLDDLMGLLRRHRIEILVDTRSQPYSRHMPHFSRDPLEEAVRDVSLQYLFMGESLGGRPDDPACYDHDGAVIYDKVEEQDFYKEAIARLMQGVSKYRVCLLCSEEDPVKCHRRLLVGRTLFRNGVDLMHIRRDGNLESEESVRQRYDAKDLPTFI